jgi:protein-S-isoprenylcysteine O-methyltransferase Ste14
MEKSILLAAIMGVPLMAFMIGGAIYLLGKDYWPGWVFGITFAVFYAVTIYMFHDKPEFVKQRFNFSGLKWWDKIFFLINIPSFVAVFIVVVLDVQNNWTGEMSFAIYIISYLALLFSMAITNWAKWTNKFFAAVVRIQKERGHKVIRTGPYAIVRHPGYVSGILMFLTIGPVLGSLWAILPGAIGVVAIIVRTYLEDTTLQKELPGYKAYTKKVRYRLLPGVW